MSKADKQLRAAQLQTMTAADIRGLLVDTLMALLNGEIVSKQARATTKACAKITQELKAQVAIMSRVMNLEKRMLRTESIL